MRSSPISATLLAVSTPGYGATAEAIFKMTVGNQIGVKLDDGIAVDDLFCSGLWLLHHRACRQREGSGRVQPGEVSEVGETTEELRSSTARRSIWPTAGWEGGMNPSSRTVPRARRRARPVENHVLRRSEEDRIHRLRRGQAARDHPRVPGQQLRIRHAARIPPRRGRRRARFMV